MRDEKLTEIMLQSLQGEAKLASFEEWSNAGNWASEIRFFPHALTCYQLANQVKKNDEATLLKINDLIDKITNVLEFVPTKIKPQVEEIRLSNPLDPSKWLAMANSLLKDMTADLADGSAKAEDLEGARFSLAFAAYCAARSGAEIESITSVLKDLIAEVDERNWTSPTVKISDMLKGKDGALKVVALGDNITLGMQPDFEIKFQETFHYLWSQELDENLSLANNGTSGAGVLDLALYLGRDLVYYKPDLAIINFGINDIWLGKEIVYAYEVLLEECVKMIQDQGTKVILVSAIPHIPSGCPPAQKPNEINDADLDIKPLADACRRVAIRTGAVLADAYSEFPQGENDRKKYFVNGFNQPNLEGQTLIKSSLLKVASN